MTLISFNSHIETIMSCEVKELENELQFNIVVNKEYASLLKLFYPKKNKDLGKGFHIHSIIKNKLSIEVNDTMIIPELEEIKTSEKGVQIQYRFLKKEQVKSIKLSAIELLGLHDDHASIDIWLYLNKQKRLFKIKKNNLSIKATY